MQFQVPQFITAEDRIVGPLTIRQFIYLGVAGGACFFLYFLVKPWLFAVGSVVLISIALALGMGQWSGRSLTHVLMAAFQYYWKPQLYLWQSAHPKKLGVSAMETMEQEAAAIQVRPTAIAGDALRSTWQALQAGKISREQFFGRREEEKYRIFQEASGARRAARRVDYR